MLWNSDSLSHSSKRNVAIWLSLTFQAGVINAGGVLACHRFVLGSMLSSFIYLSAHYWGFIIPFLISGTLWIISLGFFRNSMQGIRKTKLAS